VGVLSGKLSAGRLNPPRSVAVEHALGDLFSAFDVRINSWVVFVVGTDPVKIGLVARQAATERTIVQRTHGARVVILEASTPSEIESVFATIVRERLGALVVSGENFFLSRRDRLVELAAQHRVSTLREFVTAGGLMSYRKRYGWCLSHSWRKSRLTCRLSKPRKIEMAVNLKIAKALGLTIPLPLLGRADEVIE